MKKEQALTLQKSENSLDTMQLKIHNQMARALARFEEPEHAKLFLISLGYLLKSEDNVAHINKTELFNKLNVPKQDKEKHIRYFNMLNEMRKRTEFNITIDQDTQIAGNIISLVKRTRNEYQVKFLEEVAPTLKQLKSQFTLLYIDSIMQFKSSCSITLYNYLLSWRDPEYKINKQWLSTKQLKDLFGLDEDSYVRKDGTFNRTAFETRTIQVAIEEISSAGYMCVRWYKAKDRISKKVLAYVFEYVVLEHSPEKTDGIDFTEKKGGKFPDVIISDERELQEEADWEKYDSMTTYDQWIEDYRQCCDGIFSKAEMEEFVGLSDQLPLANMYPHAPADDLAVYRYEYILDKYRAFKVAESKRTITNKYAYFKAMIQKDVADQILLG